jgi:hypothetical protein
LLDRCDLQVDVRVRGIDDVYEEIGACHFF